MHYGSHMTEIFLVD